SRGCSGRTCLHLPTCLPPTPRLIAGAGARPVRPPTELDGSPTGNGAAVRETALRSASTPDRVPPVQRAIGLVWTGPPTRQKPNGPEASGTHASRDRHTCRS